MPQATAARSRICRGCLDLKHVPIRIADHTGAAVRAGLEIRQQCRAAPESLAARMGSLPPGVLGVGVGANSGPAEIGEFSTDRSDFTAIGRTVNLAARPESQAYGARCWCRPIRPRGRAGLPVPRRCASCV